MNFLLKLVGLLGSVSFVVACGGATTGSGNMGNTGNGSCTITAGTYTMHLVAEAGGTNCGTIPDQTLTLTGNETESGTTTVTDNDGGSGCTNSVAALTCTFSEDCTFSENGLVTTTTTTYTFEGDAATGKEVTELKNGSVIESSCTYDLTITKR